MSDENPKVKVDLSVEFETSMEAFRFISEVQEILVTRHGLSMDRIYDQMASPSESVN